MRNIVICDDEIHICHTLRMYLNKIQMEIGEEFSIHCFSSGEELVKAIPVNTDILLLDIKMAQLSGIEAARILRSQNNRVCIIFITTMVQYALEGYEVHAFGFLKKPLLYEHFKRQVLEALHSLSFREDYYITFQRGMKTIRINVNDIYYIESFGHYINIVTQNGIEEIRVTLSELNNELKNHGFFRCHRSFLVNLIHVRKIDQDKLNMANGKDVFLSRHKRREFMDEFTSYLGDIL